MRNKVVISMLGLGLLLGGCAEETTKIEDNPVQEDKIVEDTSEVAEGVVENYSSDELMINIDGETYDISRLDNIEELSTAEEVSIEYVTEENTKYATSFQVLKTKSTAVETPVTQEAKGAFVGWVDNHAIAINVDGDEMIFQTTWYENEDDFNNIADNDTVSFEFVQENDIYYITKILIGEESSVAELDATGTFIGWADTHTVLIEENGKEVSYQTTKMEDYASENGLPSGQIDAIIDGQEVAFTFSDENDVKYLLSIESLRGN